MLNIYGNTKDAFVRDEGVLRFNC